MADTRFVMDGQMDVGAILVRHPKFLRGHKNLFSAFSGSHFELINSNVENTSRSKSVLRRDRCLIFH